MSESSTNTSSTLVAGVDTHMDTHTLAILSRQGQVVSTATFPADGRGYANLINHLKQTGEVPIVGMEARTRTVPASPARYVALVTK